MINMAVSFAILDCAEPLLLAVLKPCRDLFLVAAVVGQDCAEPLLLAVLKLRT